MKKLIHLIFKFFHYFKKPAKVVPMAKVRQRVVRPQVIMQEQVDLDTATELARQWDTEDVRCPPQRRDG